MARYRTYKPELFADEKLTECTVDARFLFLGLLPFLDDMGRRQYHPRRIKAEVFPTDDEYNVGVVEGLVQELAKVGVVELYDVGRNHYLRVPHFLRHQYVRKPTHCYVPPSPSEGPNAVRCRCANCRGKYQNVENNGDNDEFLQELPHQLHTSELPVTHKERTSDAHSVEHMGGPEVIVRSKGIGIVKGENQHQEQKQDQHQPQQPNPAFETNAENRRAAKRELDEITMRVLGLLKLQANPLLIDALSKSIEVKARSRNSSVMWAGNHILGKAALVAAESPPDDWVLWFEDARYEYVPEGDSRLKDRRIEARPVCGGSRCSDGWEMVKVGDVVTLRRCPDCVRSWKDAGL